MHDDFRVVTLENLAGGALKERFDAALEKVMANIYDENTQANAIREIQLSVKMKPSDDRKVVQYVVSAKTKLVEPFAHPGTAYLTRRGGKSVIVEQSMSQTDLDFDLQTGEVNGGKK